VSQEGGVLCIELKLQRSFRTGLQPVSSGFTPIVTIDESVEVIWNRQRKDQNAEISHDKKELAHSRRDIQADKGRIATDQHERHKDIKNRNKAAIKI
jgi:hypothetical protein